MKASLRLVLFFYCVLSACSDNNGNPLCGNNVIETGEECDDGNTDDDDECSATCKVKLVETVCQELVPLGSGTCEVVAGDATIALVGDVLVPQGIFRGATSIAVHKKVSVNRK